MANNLCIVRRRYREFRRFYKEIRNSTLPQLDGLIFPKKKAIHNRSKSTVEYRRVALEHFLNTVASVPDTDPVYMKLEIFLGIERQQTVTHLQPADSELEIVLRSKSQSKPVGNPTKRYHATVKIHDEEVDGLKKQILFSHEELKNLKAENRESLEVLNKRKTFTMQHAAANSHSSRPQSPQDYRKTVSVFSANNFSGAQRGGAVLSQNEMIYLICLLCLLIILAIFL